MAIEKIRIKNYRSLKDVNVDAKALTVFVRCNDEGKSNLLRALDLFFNGDRSGGNQLDWQHDFCAIAKTPKNKASQIEIRLTFQLPSTFKLTDKVEWMRVWRQAGLYRDEIKLVDGNEIPRRSKAYAFLKQIRYDYVPAIKGPEYFEKLLSAVHDMLDATVRSEIRTAATSFTTEISKHTTGILADLEKQLGLKSDIELPSDLRRLFSDLEFRSDAGSHRVALSQRGDGIKVRHIPVILHWLADQANHLSAPGKPRVVTIWGYEEPENNLEIRRCFELAEFFVKTSPIIQTFLTTHSPVYYSVFHNVHKTRDVGIVEVQLNQSTGTSLKPRSVGVPSDVDALHSSIGFLDLLEPHVKQWKTKVDQLEVRIAEGIDLDKPTIFVEGPSDKAILLSAIKKYFPESEVKVLCSVSNGGGHEWVKDSLVAWQHSRGPCRAVGLFDKDPGSEKSIVEFQRIVEDRAKSSARAFKIRMKPRGPALELAKLNLVVPVAIEELCPKEVWIKARDEGWLEPRPGLTSLYGFSETDISFNEWIEAKVPDEVLRLIATHRVRADNKETFSNNVASNINKDDCSFNFEPFKDLVGELLQKIDGHKENT